MAACIPGARPPETFDDVLDRIRQESGGDKRALGTAFERLMRDFFKADKFYSQRFSDVYMWGEWSGRDGPDTGIDLVAYDRDNGERKKCAIQCKCYDDGTTLDQADISSFIAEARGNDDFDSLILVFTGENITNPATKKLRSNNVHVITKDHLNESSIDWSKYPEFVAKEPKTLWNYQADAVDAVVKGFKREANSRKDCRGKMIMACGTGKTLVSLGIAEKIAGRGGIVLYLVPSISLILQTMREWSDNAAFAHRYIAVCSDKSVKGEQGTILELESPVSTDPDELKVYIGGRRKDTMTVIFSTYHSIKAVEAAAKGFRFDIEASQ